jgi:hypothetical protein
MIDRLLLRSSDRLAITGTYVDKRGVSGFGMIRLTRWTLVVASEHGYKRRDPTIG